MNLIGVALLAGAVQGCSESPDEVFAQIMRKAEKNLSDKEAAEEQARSDAAKAAAQAAATAKAEAEAAAAKAKAKAEEEAKAAAEAEAAAAAEAAAKSGGGGSGGAADPKNAPEKRSESDFEATLKKFDLVGKCKEHVKKATEVRLSMVVEPDGTMTHARAKPPVHGTPLGDCLENGAKSAKFSPAQKLQMHWKTYKFKADGSSVAVANSGDRDADPDKRSDKSFLSTLKKLDAAGKCKKHVTAALETRLTIVVDPDGVVTNARAKPPVHGTPLGDCLESTMKTAKFAKAPKLQMHWHTYKFLADGTSTDAASSSKKKSSGSGASGNASAGKPVYMKKCKTCHGADGAGKTSLGAKLGIPNLKKTRGSKISKIIKNGVPGTKMKAYKDKLSSTEIADITAFVKSL